MSFFMGFAGRIGAFAAGYVLSDEKTLAGGLDAFCAEKTPEVAEAIQNFSNILCAYIPDPAYEAPLKTVVMATFVGFANEQFVKRGNVPYATQKEMLKDLAEAFAREKIFAALEKVKNSPATIDVIAIEIMDDWLGMVQTSSMVVNYGVYRAKEWYKPTLIQMAVPALKALRAVQKSSDALEKTPGYAVMDREIGQQLKVLLEGTVDGIAKSSGQLAPMMSRNTQEMVTNALKNVIPGLFAEQRETIFGLLDAVLGMAVEVQTLGEDDSQELAARMKALFEEGMCGHKKEEIKQKLSLLEAQTPETILANLRTHLAGDTSFDGEINAAATFAEQKEVFRRVLLKPEATALFERILDEKVQPVLQGGGLDPEGYQYIRSLALKFGLSYFTDIVGVMGQDQNYHSLALSEKALEAKKGLALFTGMEETALTAKVDALYAKLTGSDSLAWLQPLLKMKNPFTGEPYVELVLKDLLFAMLHQIVDHRGGVTLDDELDALFWELGQVAHKKGNLLEQLENKPGGCLKSFEKKHVREILNVLVGNAVELNALLPEMLRRQGVLDTLLDVAAEQAMPYAIPISIRAYHADENDPLVHAFLDWALESACVRVSAEEAQNAKELVEAFLDADLLPEKTPLERFVKGAIEEHRAEMVELMTTLLLNNSERIKPEQVVADFLEMVENCREYRATEEEMCSELAIWIQSALDRISLGQPQLDALFALARPPLEEQIGEALLPHVKKCVEFEDEIPEQLKEFAVQGANLKTFAELLRMLKQIEAL
ncbi:MAG: hypothetical protein KDK48_05205, partial [Chlamydiia bacterium]|nr:hypothetical protein [Chlamydiia bacterium]